MTLFIQNHTDQKEVIEQAKREGRIQFAREVRRDRINDFVERTWPKHGKPKLPRIILDTGIIEFMGQLDSEKISSGCAELNQLNWFISFMDKLPDTDDVDEVGRKAREFYFQEEKAGRTISFAQAVERIKSC